MARSFADELEAFDHQHGLEALTLAQAAAESGYSKDHIALLVASGAYENVGERGAPRIRRQDLPRKPRKATPRTKTGEPDLNAVVRAAQMT